MSRMVHPLHPRWAIPLCRVNATAASPGALDTSSSGLFCDSLAVECGECV